MLQYNNLNSNANFERSSELNAYIKSLFSTHKLEQVGKLWLQGAYIDWSFNTLNKNLHIVPLPTLSFQKTRYWLYDIQTKDDSDKLNQSLLSLFQLGRWYEVLLIVGQMIEKKGATARVLQIKAKAQANLGFMKDALDSCDHSLKIDPMDKYTYLIRGIVLVEQKDFHEAQLSFRKAIYLDNQFLEAHYQLALLLFSLDQYQLAMKSYKNALQIAEQADPMREVENIPGMTYAAFAEMLRKERLLHQGLDGDKKHAHQSRYDVGEKS